MKSIQAHFRRLSQFGIPLAASGLLLVLGILLVLPVTPTCAEQITVGGQTINIRSRGTESSDRTSNETDFSRPEGRIEVDENPDDVDISSATPTQTPTHSPTPANTPTPLVITKLAVVDGEIKSITVEITRTPTITATATLTPATAVTEVSSETRELNEIRDQLAQVIQAGTATVHFSPRMLTKLREVFSTRARKDKTFGGKLTEKRTQELHVRLHKMASSTRGGNVDYEDAQDLVKVLYPEAETSEDSDASEEGVPEEVSEDLFVEEDFSEDEEYLDPEDLGYYEESQPVETVVIYYVYPTQTPAPQQYENSQPQTDQSYSDEESYYYEEEEYIPEDQDYYYTEDEYQDEGDYYYDEEDYTSEDEDYYYEDEGDYYYDEEEYVPEDQDYYYEDEDYDTYEEYLEY